MGREWSCATSRSVVGLMRSSKVSPPLEYFVKHLPKLTTFALPLAVYGLSVDKTMVPRLLAPAAIFVAVMSFLGHKEWRFIVYVVPFVNVCAAVPGTNHTREESHIPRHKARQLSHRQAWIKDGERYTCG